MLFKEILKEITKILKKISEKDIKTYVREVNQAKRIYIIGAGRSGLVAKNLAMRLVRLNKEIFVVHETVNPQIKNGDLLIAISGSGETNDILDAVKISRMMGAKVLSLIADKNSSLVKISHEVIVIPAQLPVRLGSHYYLRELIGVPERSPTKSLFELCALIFLEVAISRLNGN